MEAPVAILSLVLMVPLFIWAKRSMDKVNAQTDSAWMGAAKALGGRYTPHSTKWLNFSPRRIEAEVQGVAVTVDHYTSGSGKNKSTYTRAVAKSQAPGDFKLRVYRAHFLSGLGRALGFQDVEVGDRGFDEAFVIKSNDPEAAVLWLNQGVRRCIGDAHGVNFEIERGKVTAKRPSLLRDEGSLVALVRAVAAIADGRHRVVKAWRKLGTKYGGKVKKRAGRWATLHLELDGVPMHMDTRKLGKQHYTFVTGQVVGARLTPLVLASDPHLYQSTLPRDVETTTPEGYSLWTADPRGAQAQLTPAVCALIDGLQPAKVRVDEEEVTVTWDGVATRQSEMERAMRLCAELTAGAGRGPYR